MSRIIFHSLKGKPGWSFLSINKIDIAKIVSVFHNKRKFMITDTKYPYTLYIKYSHISNLTTFISTGGGTGIIPINITTYTSTITKRYKSLSEILNELDEIKNKQIILKNYIKKLNKEISK